MKISLIGCLLLGLLVWYFFKMVTFELLYGWWIAWLVDWRHLKTFALPKAALSLGIQDCLVQNIRYWRLNNCIHDMLIVPPYHKEIMHVEHFNYCQLLWLRTGKVKDLPYYLSKTMAIVIVIYAQYPLKGKIQNHSRTIS